METNEETLARQITNIAANKELHDPNQATIPEIVGTDTVADEDKRLLRRAALEVVEATANALDKYFALCTVIHDRKIMPKVARAELVACGFDKVRVSEILRVSLTTDEIFEQYRQKAIGFKLALQKARTGEFDEKVTKPKSERQRFEQKLSAAFEEFLPVAGDWPAYLNPEGFGLVIEGYDGQGAMAVQAHGRTYWVVVKRMAQEPAKKKKLKAHSKQAKAA